MRGALWVVVCLVACCEKGSVEAAEEATYSVREFGAAGDGQTLDTDAINAAITECAANGGGIVLFPPGTYLTGSIRLKSNITLDIQKGATIRGASNDVQAYDPAEDNPYDEYQDYGHSHWHNSLIWGEELENVVIRGLGIIHGGGMTRSNDVPEGGGDKAIALKLCRKISIRDVTIREGGHFAILLSGCEDIEIDNIEIYTYRDGINLDCFTRKAVIKNSYIESVRYSDGVPAGGDDAIALKSSYALGRMEPSENITVQNCTIRAGTNGLQFGSETAGDFTDVNFSDITILGAEKAGIGITCNDGSIIDGVTYRNITMSNVATPIFIKIGARGRAPENRPVGQIRNITLTGITATDVYGYIKERKWASTIAGHPDRSVENVSLENVSIIYKGGGAKEWAEFEPPITDDYSPRHLGIRPSYGFYCRFVSGLEFHNVEVGFEEADLRPGLQIEHAESVELSEVTAERADESDALLVLKDVRDVNIHDCAALPDTTLDDVSETTF